ncbi:RNA polymerase sigma factor (sigma-70 family) [Kribbella sp. VKM Ac-2527]|uniref:RNA polymerase sigma factor (Sigma-70 family) n=1 Tax=Kribbella caucasensis TaxID=2512215 RepID=A0A4R6KDS2_9ACTN|nr:sigma-70 family RNA polymerase sigma factor [Kribbella sp. VKM Ac-2527]TDO48387.1 RNA polymerase sigma factor (sigma-70 family) [Kribbella sp. VKM Ac-2527]
MSEERVEGLLRELAPQVLGYLARRNGQFDLCEDAVQEALLAAATQWPVDGVPSNPRGWLITVASRKLTDAFRSESARRRREDSVAAMGGAEELVAPAADHDQQPESDDTLTLLFLCCHPAVTPASQVALTLRAVGGLTTAEIARAFMVPEATMAPRISRAKKSIKAAGSRFVLPPEEERADRLRVVLQVLYLIFNEGYTASSGEELQRVELTAEAIRLTRMLHELLPDDGEVAGLLALMLLTDSRRTARTTADGSLVPIDEQDRSLWDRKQIEEGAELILRTLARGAVGPYQVQAAIGAIHAEAPTTEETDWRQILGLYLLLERLAPNPMVTLNRAIALAQVAGPQAGLELLATLDDDKNLTETHRLDAVRAHLLERAGDLPAARDHYLAAARRTTSLPEQRYLTAKAAGLSQGSS